MNTPRAIACSGLLLAILSGGCATRPNADSPAALYRFHVQTATGEKVSLDQYRGKVLLIVNVASKCGFTKQYEGLQALREKYRERGFEILGFPCNQFRNQEPGTNEEIQTFCRSNFGVTFPVFAKLEVNGENAHPLYQYLKHAAPGLGGTEGIKWNFTKFLIARDGTVVRRYPSAAKPEGLAGDIEEQLAK